MTTDTRDAATAPARTLPAFWHADLIPFTYYRYDLKAYVDVPEGPASYVTPLPLYWEPDGIAPHRERVQVGTVEDLATTAGEAAGRLIPVLSGAGILDLKVPGFAELVAAAVRCAPYGRGDEIADGAGGFLLGVRADLDDIVREPPTADTEYHVTGFRLASVTITGAPAYREGTYLRLDDIPHEFKP